MQCPWSELQLLTFSELDQGVIEAAAGLVVLPGGAVDSANSDRSAGSSVSVNANGKRARAPVLGASTSAVSSSSSTGGRRFHPCPSPFPRLEQFLLSQLQPQSPEVRIRGWTYFKEQRHGASSSPSSASAPSASPPASVRHTVSFNVDGHRFCGNIGRPHRSNGVYFLLDLAARTCVQRCWDPQCRYYSSPPTAVPHWVAELDLEAVERGDDAEDDDDDLAIDQRQEEEIVRRAREKAQRTVGSAGAVTAAASAHDVSAAGTAAATVAPVASAALPAPSATVTTSSFLMADDDDDWDVDVLAALEAKALQGRAASSAPLNQLLL